jgi:hypothetical protein
MGRGLQHFSEHGAKLVSPPTAPDAYEEEAYAMWQLREKQKRRDLFG